MRRDGMLVVHAYKRAHAPMRERTCVAVPRNSDSADACRRTGGCDTSGDCADARAANASQAAAALSNNAAANSCRQPACHHPGTLSMCPQREGVGSIICAITARASAGRRASSLWHGRGQEERVRTHKPRNDVWGSQWGARNRASSFLLPVSSRRLRPLQTSTIWVARPSCCMPGDAWNVSIFNMNAEQWSQPRLEGVNAVPALILPRPRVSHCSVSKQQSHHRIGHCAKNGASPLAACGSRAPSDEQQLISHRQQVRARPTPDGALERHLRRTRPGGVVGGTRVGAAAALQVQLPSAMLQICENIRKPATCQSQTLSARISVSRQPAASKRATRSPARGDLFAVFDCSMSLTVALSRASLSCAKQVNASAECEGNLQLVE